MLQTLSSPFMNTFQAFSGMITESCFICSPYVSQDPAKSFVRTLSSRGQAGTVAVDILTDLSLSNIVSGSTDLAALLYLQENLTKVRVSHLPHVHAKVYIADSNYAIVGSANWTNGGSSINYEYAIGIDDPKVVQRIHAEISEYAGLGGVASIDFIRNLQEQTEPLREQARRDGHFLKQAMDVAQLIRLETAEDSLLRIRVSGRSLNAIFSDTISYLLRSGPMTTEGLNERIRQIHPDLCDDSVDRVIDGVHYGKKWKHSVRSAQVALQRNGSIVYDKESRLYRLT